MRLFINGIVWLTEREDLKYFAFWGNLCWYCSLWPFIFFADIQFNSKEFWGFICFSLAAWLLPDIFYADHRYCYSLTQAGIYYTDQEVIPDAAYTFVRGFAWVGIAVCLLALAVVGPLAFVGAGGFALLAFGLTNFHPTVHKKEVYFADQLIVLIPSKKDGGFKYR